MLDVEVVRWTRQLQWPAVEQWLLRELDFVGDLVPDVERVVLERHLLVDAGPVAELLQRSSVRLDEHVLLILRDEWPWHLVLRRRQMAAVLRLLCRL
jgi:hypothetical protein